MRGALCNRDSEMKSYCKGIISSDYESHIDARIGITISGMECEGCGGIVFMSRLNEAYNNIILCIIRLQSAWQGFGRKAVTRSSSSSFQNLSQLLELKVQLYLGVCQTKIIQV